MKQGLLDRSIGADAADDWPEEKRAGAVRTLLNHRELVQSLIRRDIRSRYKQSALGIAWALLQPLMMAVVYTIVFSHIVKVNTGPIPYPLFSYTALLPWTFFSQGLVFGTECLTSNFNLITKVYFPREVFPISSVLGKTVDLALGIIVLIPLFIYYHVQMTWMILLVVPVLLIQLCLMLGITFLLSAFNLFYRDIRHGIPLLITIWMYLTPIVYPMSLVPEKYLSVYMLNPMAAIMNSLRGIALQGQTPDWAHLAYAAGFAIVLLVVGYRTFKKLEPAFAEMI